jgi:phosphocarrier protein HPr
MVDPLRSTPGVSRSNPTVFRIMQTRKVKITNRLGVHARAAAKIVKVASRFRSHVFLVVEDRRASASSMLAVMMLAASMGSVVRLETRGPDEAAAMTAMVKLIDDGFGEMQ